MVFVPNKVWYRIFFQPVLYRHLNLDIPLVIELEQIPFLHIMLRQIACSATVDLGRLAGNTEITDEVFAFLQFLFFQSKYHADTSKR